MTSKVLIKRILLIGSPVLLLILGIFALTGKQTGDDPFADARLWLPGTESARALAPQPGQTAAEAREEGVEDLRAMEGEAGYQNTIKIPELAAGMKKTQPAAQNEQKSAPTPAEQAENTRLFASAITLMKEGRLEAAEQELTQFVAACPDDPEGWRQLGDCRYNLNRVSEALGAYRIALRKDEGNYLAERGRGIAALYLGYDAWEKDKKRLAHSYFQTSLESLHTCLKTRAGDELARYGQALAAEGASRQLYIIATKALEGENNQQAKEVIRNCLDIVDTAIQATEERLEKKPTDSEARMLLGCLLIRRARILQPFGHIDEAKANLQQAVRAFETLTATPGKRSDTAKGQKEICEGLIKKWSGERASASIPTN